MTIRHLTYFIKVSQTLSISKAAEELHVAQPSVSQTIKELENYYGITLFNRNRKSLSLTKEGSELLIKAIDSVNSFKEFEITASKAKEDKDVHIGASLSFGKSILPLMIAAIKKEIPDIQYYLYINKTIDLETKLMKGEIDFALAEGLPTNKCIKSIVFGYDKLVLVAGNSYSIPDKINLVDIAKYDLLVREPASNPRKLLDYTLALKGIKITPRMESISNLAILNMVISNEGTALMPVELVKPYIDNKQMREIALEKEMSRPLHIIYHNKKRFSKVEKRALDVAIKTLQGLSTIQEVK